MSNNFTFNRDVVACVPGDPITVILVRHTYDAVVGDNVLGRHNLDLPGLNSDAVASDKHVPTGRAGDIHPMSHASHHDPHAPSDATSDCWACTHVEFAFQSSLLKSAEKQLLFSGSSV